MRRVIIILLALLPIPASATTRYIAQTAGTVTCNGGSHTAITPATWNSTTEFAGDISYVCGTITGSAGASFLTFGWSGTSGNPISLIFDTGSSLQAPYLNSGTSGAIIISGQSWIVIDGQNSGVIESTLNGTSGAACPGGSCTNQQDSIGINITNSTNIAIQNLTIGPMYYRVSTDSADGSGTGINVNNQSATGATNITINNNIIHDASAGIFWFYGSSESGFLLENSELYRNNWGLGAGAASNNLSVAGVQIHNNKFHDFSNWDDYPTPYNNHHDATTIFGGQTNNSVAGCYVWNNEYYGDFGSGTSPGLYVDNVSTARFTCTAFNNLFHLNSSGPGGTGAFDAQNESGSGPVTFNAYNNTIYVTLANNQGLSGMWIEGTNVTTDFRNNIVVGWQYDLVTNNSGPLPTTSNFNDFYTSGTDLFNNNGTTYSTVSAWHTATSLDTNSVGTNPNLNTSTWIPNSGSPVIGLGTNLTSLCTGVLTALCSDKAGNARPSSGTWDAGALNSSSSPQASTPTFSPVAGTYTGTQSVSISASSGGAIICYNATGSPHTNGSTGCGAGTLYSGAVSVATSETLYAVAGGTGFTDSAVGSAAYIINPPPPASSTVISTGVSISSGVKLH